MKRAKRAAIVLGILSLFAFMGFSSFYASGVFIVRVKKIHGKSVADKYGQVVRRVTFKVLRHTNGQGHIMDLYKKYVGKTFTVNLVCKKKASHLVPSQKVRVKYEYISGFIHDRKTGKTSISSSKTWRLIGSK